MFKTERHPYITADPALGEAGFRPFLPITLVHQQQTLLQVGLLDTGAMVNVMPYPVGLSLGYLWDRQTTRLNLTGNLAQFDARVVLVKATVGAFESVNLAFAWTLAENVPLILGQVNFFMEFDVCFHRSQLYLEVCPKSRKRSS
jgi:hypothetical protein